MSRNSKDTLAVKIMLMAAMAMLFGCKKGATESPAVAEQTVAAEQKEGTEPEVSPEVQSVASVEPEEFGEPEPKKHHDGGTKDDVRMVPETTCLVVFNKDAESISIQLLDDMGNELGSNMLEPDAEWSVGKAEPPAYALVDGVTYRLSCRNRYVVIGRLLKIVRP